MKISLLMKQVSSGVLPISVLMAFSALSVTAAESVPVGELLEAVSLQTAEANCLTKNLRSLETIASGFETPSFMTKKVSQQPMRVQVNSTVKSEVLVDENFSKWTAGTQSEPSTEMVTDEQVAELMDYTGDWTAFRMYEAGGAGYMGYDEIGADGPGYLKSPNFDFKEGSNYWRLICHVKNVNANNQEQGLQLFVFNEATSSIITASAKPMQYEEWCECEWIGSSSSDLTSFMAFGWQGKVLIDEFKLEKLIFPLSTPVVLDAELLPDGSVKVSWEKVTGATSYTVEVQEGFETILTEEYGDVDSCILNFEIDSEASYTFYVTAHNGEEISYPGYKATSLIPQYVGATVAKDATDITETGFTANWEAADFASAYLVMPTLTHTAAENGEEFYYLNELFANVPESADMYAPIQIAPMLGFEGTDIYMSRAGWSVDMGMFVRLAPEMPVLALTNQYAMYGLKGSLTSPVTDYSVGEGKVKVSGMAISSVDDVVMLCGFVDAEDNLYSSETFEITTEGTMIEMELTGGRADSRFVFQISETAEGGDMVLIPMLSVSTVLNEGETVTVPAETVHAGKVTEARVEVPVNDYNKYSYCVQGYFSNELMGAISEEVDVNATNNVTGVEADFEGKVYATDGIISLVNPAGLVCEIYTLDGKCVFATSAESAQIRLTKGMYVVRIGDKSFKIFN